MVTLDSFLRIPHNIKCTRVDDDAVLLDTRTNQYFALTEVGARFWELLSEGKSLRAAYNSLLAEYLVDSAGLEHDLLELTFRLLENGLVEMVEG